MSEWSDDFVTIHHGDAWELAPTLAPQSVHTIVTSPPYWGLRDYGEPGQFGLESTPDEYVARLVSLFALLRPALRDDGTVWLNLGDSFSTHAAGKCANPHATSGLAGIGTQVEARAKKEANEAYRNSPLPEKNLIGIPWRVAFALQADGWYLRSDIIWHKPNPMPESVTDRPTKAHEYVFLLSKKARYYYDAEAIKERGVGTGNQRLTDADRNVDARGTNHSYKEPHTSGTRSGGNLSAAYAGVDWATEGRNKRSVWTIPTRPFSQAHFAVFPPDLIKPCILAGAPERCCPECGAPWERQVEREKTFTGWQSPATKDHQPDGHAQNYVRNGRGQCGGVASTTTGFTPTCSHGHEPIGGTVLDPFMGSGTTAQVARSLGRKAVGFELNVEYIEIAAKHRLAQGVLL